MLKWAATLILAVTVVGAVVATAAALEVHGGTIQVFQFAVTPPAPVSATVRIEPESLQKKSQGQHITVFITLPGGRSVGDIDPESVRLALDAGACAGGLRPDGAPKVVGHQMKAVFARAAVIALVAEVEPPATVTFTVCGLVAGQRFVGSDTVRLVGPGKESQGAPADEGLTLPLPTLTPTPTPTPSPSPSATGGRVLVGRPGFPPTEMRTPAPAIQPIVGAPESVAEPARPTAAPSPEPEPTEAAPAVPASLSPESSPVPAATTPAHAEESTATAGPEESSVAPDEPATDLIPAESTPTAETTATPEPERPPAAEPAPAATPSASTTPPAEATATAEPEPAPSATAESTPDVTPPETAPPPPAVPSSAETPAS